MLISLIEYATRLDIDPSRVRRKAINGDFKTAQKIGRNWVIDSDEPYIDKRYGNKRYKDLSGMRFGRLCVIGLHSRENRLVLWDCKCDCGNMCVVSRDCLISGNVSSCGCLAD